MPTTVTAVYSLPDAATVLGVSYFRLLRTIKADPELEARCPRVGAKRVITGDVLAMLRIAMEASK